MMTEDQLKDKNARVFWLNGHSKAIYLRLEPIVRGRSVFFNSMRTTCSKMGTRLSLERLETEMQERVAPHLSYTVCSTN